MKINDLEIGEIYVDSRKRTTPSYYLVLDVKTTYKTPVRNTVSYTFKATGTQKSHANGQGVLVLRSTNLDYLGECSMFVSPEYFASIAQVNPSSLRDIVNLELARRVGRVQHQVILAVINPLFLTPVTNKELRDA